MRGSSALFSQRLKIWFYSIFGVLFFSGVIWLLVHYGKADNEAFDGPYSSLEPFLLRVHGAAAMASLLVLGVLIPTHMRRAWQQRRNRITAAVMVLACVLMIMSGYGLYYCGSDQWRTWISGFH
ncbi:MAG: hypothetical protein NUV91_07420, partial [Candidatus Omnitrophica bacterium]|nr:hypothetical protein [Candidatus Omnitrophota bacterium]